MPLILFYPLLLPILWFKSRLRHVVVVVLLGYYAVYDLIDYSTIYLGVGFLAKILPEILLIGFLVLYSLKSKRYSRYTTLNLLFIGIVAVIFISIIPLQGGVFSREILEMRNILRPLLFFVLIRDTCRFTQKQYFFVFKSFIIISMIIFLVGIFQYVTFDGDYQSVWRYGPLLDAKLEKGESFLQHFMEYQIIRNEQLRASGPFYSALDFGYLAGIVSLISYIYLVSSHRESIKRSVWFLCMLVGLLACYVSGVRSAFILFLFGVGFNYLIMGVGEVRRWVHVSTLVTLCVSIFYILDYFQTYLDSSAIGRLYQLSVVSSSLSFFGHGFSTARFDSGYLYYVNAVGVFSIPFVCYVFYLFFPSNPSDDTYRNVNKRSLYIAGLAILLILSFQFVIGSFAYKAILILLACVPRGTEKDEPSYRSL